MKDRFDLEQEILDCWHVVDDIDMLLEAVLDKEISTDQISNVLLGMKEIYQLKFNRTFETFEALVQNGEIH